MKPFSGACERNKTPIFEHIKKIYNHKNRILEIGSGTGQHAAHFAQKLPNIIWQTSDVRENHIGIDLWIEDVKNALPPIELNVAQEKLWPTQTFSDVYTANTCHIMSWSEVEKMFCMLEQVLEKHATLCIYGPFKYSGEYTSESNQGFDNHLKSIAPHMGIRNFEDIEVLASNLQLKLIADHAMPANNQLLHFARG